MKQLHLPIGRIRRRWKRKVRSLPEFTGKHRVTGHAQPGLHFPTGHPVIEYQLKPNPPRKTPTP